VQVCSAARAFDLTICATNDATDGVGLNGNAGRRFAPFTALVSMRSPMTVADGRLDDDPRFVIGARGIGVHLLGADCECWTRRFDPATLSRPADSDSFPAKNKTRK
jgi:hypothetical protein